MNTGRVEQSRGEGHAPRDPWILGLALALLGIQLLTRSQFLIEDAFIAFRYARNWAELGAPMWNPGCLLYTSPSPRDLSTSRMPSSA